MSLGTLLARDAIGNRSVRRHHPDRVVWSVVAVLATLTMSVGWTIHAFASEKAPALVFLELVLIGLSIALVTYFVVDHVASARYHAKDLEVDVEELQSLNVSMTEVDARLSGIEQRKKAPG